MSPGPTWDAGRGCSTEATATVRRDGNRTRIASLEARAGTVAKIYRLLKTVLPTRLRTS